MKLGDAARFLRSMFGGSGSKLYGEQRAILAANAAHVHRTVLAAAGDDTDPDEIEQVARAFEIRDGYRVDDGSDPMLTGLVQVIGKIPTVELDCLLNIEDDNEMVSTLVKFAREILE